MDHAETEVRTFPDRRASPTRPLDAFRRGGRRMANRRASDDARNIHFDRFPGWTLVLIVLLLAMTIADGVFTLILIDAGCEEANPAMQSLLVRGPATFLVGKYALTALGLPFLVIFARHRMFVPGLRIGHVLPVAVGLYGFLLGYQVWLMMGTG